MGPLELVIDVPFDAGCYEILSPLAETPIAAGEVVTPSWCITECLKSSPAKRFACENFITLSLNSIRYHNGVLISVETRRRMLLL